MATPSEGSATTIDRVQINWIAMSTLAETGGTLSIQSYNLQMFDSQTAAWTELVGETTDFTQLTHTETSLTVGQSYRFRVRAKNVHGFGPYSDEFVTVADDVPPKMDPVTTTSNSLVVNIEWNAPLTSNGATIDKYSVMIETKLNGFVKESVYCNEEDLTLVISRQCLIPHSILRQAPYLLEQGDTVIAKVQAHNSNGFGEFSDANPTLTAALIETEPAKMSTLLNGPLTDEEGIDILWTALTGTETGGSEIESYNLQWDKGSYEAQGGSPTWYNFQGFEPPSLSLTAFLSAEVTPGQTYRFQVRAKNVHGFGLFSDSIDIKAAGLPDAISQV